MGICLRIFAWGAYYMYCRKKTFKNMIRLWGINFKCWSWFFDILVLLKILSNVGIKMCLQAVLKSELLLSMCKVLLLNMCNTLELSGLLLCLGGDLLSFSMPGETEKIAGLWFARGGSVPMLTLWLIFQRLFNNDWRWQNICREANYLCVSLLASYLVFVHVKVHQCHEVFSGFTL